MTSINIYWYVLPLAVAISLVYAASRHERWPIIVTHAARLCMMILLVLVAATAVMIGLNLII